MPTPGAKMSTQLPKFEKEAMLLSAATAPTVMALGADAVRFGQRNRQQAAAAGRSGGGAGSVCGLWAMLVVGVLHLHTCGECQVAATCCKTG